MSIFSTPRNTFHHVFCLARHCALPGLSARRDIDLSTPPSLACLDLHSARSPSRFVSYVWVRLLPRAPRSQRKANDNDLRYLYMIYYALFCSVESGGTIATTPLPWQRGHGNRFSKLTVRAGRIAWTADAGGIARSGYCA